MHLKNVVHNIIMDNSEKNVLTWTYSAYSMNQLYPNMFWMRNEILCQCYV